MNEKIEIWYKTDKALDWKGGRLRAWSTSSDDKGPYPVAVVEDEKTGCVHAVHVELLCFATIPPR